MGCRLEFPQSLVNVEFCCQGSKQRMLIDILTRYGEMDLPYLASEIGVSTQKIKNISNGKYFLVGDKADSLAQLFLMFFGKQFFRQCNLIRTYVD